MSLALGDFCENFVVSNNATVTAQTVEELQGRDETFQDLVDCLTDGGSVTFDIRRFSVNGTIEVRQNITFASLPGTRTQLRCDNQPIFDVRCDCSQRNAVRLQPPVLWQLGECGTLGFGSQRLSA